MIDMSGQFGRGPNSPEDNTLAGDCHDGERSQEINKRKTSQNRGNRRDLDRSKNNGIRSRSGNYHHTLNRRLERRYSNKSDAGRDPEPEPGSRNSEDERSEWVKNTSSVISESKSKPNINQEEGEKPQTLTRNILKAVRSLSRTRSPPRTRTSKELHSGPIISKLNSFRGKTASQTQLSASHNSSSTLNIERINSLRKSKSSTAKQATRKENQNNIPKNSDAEDNIKSRRSFRRHGSNNMKGTENENSISSKEFANIMQPVPLPEKADLIRRVRSLSPGNGNQRQQSNAQHNARVKRRGRSPATNNFPKKPLIGTKASKINTLLNVRSRYYVFTQGNTDGDNETIVSDLTLPTAINHSSAGGIASKVRNVVHSVQQCFDCSNRSEITKSPILFRKANEFEQKPLDCIQEEDDELENSAEDLKMKDVFYDALKNPCARMPNNFSYEE